MDPIYHLCYLFTTEKPSGLPIANGAYYHLIYAFATEKRSGIKPPLHKGSTFATVGCGVFLQAGDGHGHLVRQAPFLGPR